MAAMLELTRGALLSMLDRKTPENVIIMQLLGTAVLPGSTSQLLRLYDGQYSFYRCLCGPDSDLNKQLQNGGFPDNSVVIIDEFESGAEIINGVENRVLRINKMRRIKCELTSGTGGDHRAIKFVRVPTIRFANFIQNGEEVLNTIRKASGVTIRPEGRKALADSSARLFCLMGDIKAVRQAQDILNHLLTKFASQAEEAARQEIVRTAEAVRLEMIRQADEAAQKEQERAACLETLRQAEDVARQLLAQAAEAVRLETIRQADEAAQKEKERAACLETVRQANEAACEEMVRAKEAVRLEAIRQAEESARRDTERATETCGHSTITYHLLGTLQKALETGRDVILSPNRLNIVVNLSPCDLTKFTEKGYSLMNTIRKECNVSILPRNRGLLGRQLELEGSREDVLHTEERILAAIGCSAGGLPMNARIFGPKPRPAARQTTTSRTAIGPQTFPTTVYRSAAGANTPMGL